MITTANMIYTIIGIIATIIITIGLLYARKVYCAGWMDIFNEIRKYDNQQAVEYHQQMRNDLKQAIIEAHHELAQERQNYHEQD